MRRKQFLLRSSILALALLLTGCGIRSQQAGVAEAAETSVQEEAHLEQERSFVSSQGEMENPSSQTENKEEASLWIQVETETQNILFRLNDSSGAKSLYDQLPLSLTVENFSDNEKIFYPPEPLDVSDTPLANGPAGTLAYYEPWGDVVMFYDTYSQANGLYQLGEAVSGADEIGNLTGEIRIEKSVGALQDEDAQNSGTLEQAQNG